MSSHEAVIVAGARTAIGTAFKGSLADTDALDLGTRAVAEAVRRSGIEPELFDDVVLGESLYGGGDIARYAAIEAGLVSAPGHRETPDAPIRDMSITVGWNAAVKAGVSRQDMDAWAFRSHMRAIAGIDNGSFAQEIFPILVTRRDGSTFTFAVDEHPRRCLLYTSPS